MELDNNDVALLLALQRDGRASFESLSHEVGLSRTAVRARVERLLGGGVVRIVGVVHPWVYGLAAGGHVAVYHHGPARPVAEAIAELADVPFVSVVAGDCAVVAELRSADMTDLERAIAAIRAVPCVTRVSTAAYTRVVKDPSLPPRGLREADLDETDLRLIALLQADGRTSATELAERVRLSPGATRNRILRIMDAGVIHVGSLINPAMLGVTDVCGFELLLDGDPADILPKVAQLEDVNYLAAAIGRCDAVGTLLGRTRTHVLETLEQVRSLPGIRHVGSWTHLDRVKERYERPLPSGASLRVSPAGAALGLRWGSWESL
jgi:DNA-binding Lrp family transcriptional regulator